MLTVRYQQMSGVLGARRRALGAVSMWVRN